MSEISLDTASLTKPAYSNTMINCVKIQNVTKNVKKGILKYVGGTQITTDANSVTLRTNILRCKVQSTF